MSAGAPPPLSWLDARALQPRPKWKRALTRKHEQEPANEKRWFVCGIPFDKIVEGLATKVVPLLRTCHITFRPSDTYEEIFCGRNGWGFLDRNMRFIVHIQYAGQRHGLDGLWYMLWPEVRDSANDKMDLEEPMAESGIDFYVFLQCQRLQYGLTAQEQGFITMAAWRLVLQRQLYPWLHYLATHLAWDPEVGPRFV